jgi:ketosteroid isomerase-like protein
MPTANVDLVRSIYAAWDRGDFTKSDWAHPEIEYVITDGPHPGRWIGIVAVADVLHDELRAWDDFRAKATGFRELDAERVLALVQFRASGKTSAIEVDQESAEVFHVRNGNVTRIVVYWDRDRALADLGLKDG